MVMMASRRSLQSHGYSPRSPALATDHVTLDEHQATNGQYGGQTYQHERGLCRDA